MPRGSALSLVPVVFILACSEEVPADSGVNAVITRNAESNTEIFAEEIGTGGGTNITRYICSKAVTEALTSNESLDELTIVKAKCNHDPPIPRHAFVIAWTSAYLAAENFRILGVRDGSGELNEQESAALANLSGELGWLTTSSRVTFQEGPAVDTAKAVFLNAIDVAYDNALQRSIPAPAAVPTAGVAASSRVVLGAFKLPASKVTKAAEFRAKSESATPVDFIQLTLTPSRCATVKSVVAVASDGTTAINTIRTTRTGHRFALNKRNASLLSVAITVIKRKSADESGFLCNIKLTGGSVEAATRSTPEERDATMRTYMARRDHRIWHYLWHGIRGSWPRMSTRQRTAVGESLGVVWTRPQEPSRDFAVNRGEEFLHMHRAMLGMLRDKLGQDMYEPWTTIPAEDDPTSPVPTENRDPETYAELKRWDAQAKDETFLRSKSLGEYGAWLEENLHNGAHMYWSDAAIGDKYGPLEPQSIFAQSSADADATENDYLGSTYASHVNPVFYRIHGYVNARIEDWTRANGYTSISDAQSCAAPTCYKWRGVWDGPMPHAVTSDATIVVAAGEGPTAEQVKTVATDRGLARLVHNNSNVNPVAPESATSAAP